MLKFILFICVFSTNSCNSLINPHGPTVLADWSSCINEVVDNMFTELGLLTFAYTDETNIIKLSTEIIKDIHDDNRYSLEVLTPVDNEVICKEYSREHENGYHQELDFSQVIPAANYCVIITDSYQEFTRVANRCISSKSWNPEAFFIIILYNLEINEKEQKEAMENILECFYRAHVTNIIVMVPNTPNIRKINIYSWKPFDPPKFCGYKNETAKSRMILEGECERGKLNDNHQLFENKIPKTMKGCVLDILALERQPFVSFDPNDLNLEMELLKEIATVYDFKLNFSIKNVSRGEKISDEFWNGGVNDLIARKGDLLIGGIFPDDEIHREFQCSETYLTDAYTWVVPRAKQVPDWQALVIIFTVFVWYLALAAFTISVIFWRVLGQVSGDSIYHQNLGHNFMNALVSNLGFCAYARPVKQSLRVFFIFFSLYCICFVTAYQTKLIDVLTNPSFEYQIKTVEELVESNIKFGGLDEMHDLFKNSDDLLDEVIAKEWVHVSSSAKALKDVVVYRNYSFLCSRLELAYISANVPELSDSFGNLKYFAFDDNVLTVPIEMVGLRGFPFIKEISKTLELFKQMGLAEELRNKYAEFTKRRRAMLLTTMENTGSNVKPLSLKHLQGGFYALALGYILGTVVFILEIFLNSQVYKKYRKIFFDYMNNKFRKLK